MKNISRIIFATVIASTLLVGCGNKKVVETEELETLEEKTNEGEDVASSGEASGEETETPQMTTIESYFNEHPEELQKAIDDIEIPEGEGRVDLEANGNTVTMKYIMPEEFNEEQIAGIAKEIQPSLDSEESVELMNDGKKQFSVFVDSKWEGITIVVTYLDAVGHEIISKTY